ncbi:MAG: metallophosphoesterase [Rikenellaceae bacterium]
MKIIATSDLHGHLPQIESCDILIIAGDITPKALDGELEAQKVWYREIFLVWANAVDCRDIVIVPGNHDMLYTELFPDASKPYPWRADIAEQSKIIPLCNSLVELQGVTIYGTPALAKNKSKGEFTLSGDTLVQTLNMIPARVDFLVTHNPPCGIEGLGYSIKKGIDKGSKELTRAIENRDIRYVICGHAHEGNHREVVWRGKRLLNVSLCDGAKQPKNPPVTINI